MKKYIFFILIFLVSLVVVFLPKSASAYTNSRIIDDSVFDNVNTMSAASVQSFLNQFPNSCIKNYQAPDPQSWTSYGGNVSAAQAIYDSAHIWGINPQVILTTLQKEEQLIDGSQGCAAWKYWSAMGYDCPSSATHSYPETGGGATCVAHESNVGFSAQINHGSWQLEFGRWRSEGDGNFSWDGDGAITYYGYMTQGCRARIQGGSVACYDGNITLSDGTSLHVENGATASLYSYTPFLQSFGSIFNNWFGQSVLPAAITSGNGVIYLTVDGYKLNVPSMAMLQDYGISPQSIVTMSQSSVDSIPAPPQGSGISSSIGYLVQSSSGSATIYLVSVGKLYSITSMQQFNDFGFNVSNIVTLPQDFITGMYNGNLSNFVYSPTHSAFQIGSGQKRIIFDYPTYQSLNPGGSATPFSYYLADSIPSGSPISNRDILIRLSSGAIFLLLNGNYYSVPSMNSYTCWGFGSTQTSPQYQPAEDSYIATFTPQGPLPCIISDGTSSFLLNRVNKVLIPSQLGISNPQVLDQDEMAIANNLTTVSGPLLNTIKPNNSGSIWFIENGFRKIIPSFNQYQLLGSPQFMVLDPSAVSSIPSNGDFKLGTGAVVKDDSSSAVYVIDANHRDLFSSGEDFLAYRNSWGVIESYPSSQLSSLYPYTSIQVNKYLYDQASGGVYLADINGCYNLGTTLATDYGQNPSSLQSSQGYSSSLFKNLVLSSCKNGSNYAKSPNSSTIYSIKNGTKSPFASWSSLVSKSGSNNPYIVLLSDTTLQALATGSPIQ
jgi:hypothetical protein